MGLTLIHKPGVCVHMRVCVTERKKGGGGREMEGRGPENSSMLFLDSLEMHEAQ